MGKQIKRFLPASVFSRGHLQAAGLFLRNWGKWFGEANLGGQVKLEPHISWGGCSGVQGRSGGCEVGCTPVGSRRVGWGRAGGKSCPCGGRAEAAAAEGALLPCDCRGWREPLWASPAFLGAPTAAGGCQSQNLLPQTTFRIPALFMAAENQAASETLKTPLCKQKSCSPWESWGPGRDERVPFCRTLEGLDDFSSLAPRGFSALAHLIFSGRMGEKRNVLLLLGGVWQEGPRWPGGAGRGGLWLLPPRMLSPSPRGLAGPPRPGTGGSGFPSHPPRLNIIS